MIDIFELLEKAETDEEVNELYDMTFNDLVLKFNILPGQQISKKDLDEQE